MAKEETKRTVAGIPTWSPTVVLICRSTAYVWQSGRVAQFSADCGRACLMGKFCKLYTSNLMLRSLVSGPKHLHHMAKHRNHLLKLYIYAAACCCHVQSSKVRRSLPDVCQRFQYERLVIVETPYCRWLSASTSPVTLRLQTQRTLLMIFASSSVMPSSIRPDRDAAPSITPRNCQCPVGWTLCELPNRAGFATRQFATPGDFSLKVDLLVCRAY